LQHDPVNLADFPALAAAVAVFVASDPRILVERAGAESFDPALPVEHAGLNTLARPRKAARS
jgi:hypothetical protein